MKEELLVFGVIELKEPVEYQKLQKETKPGVEISLEYWVPEEEEEEELETEYRVKRIKLYATSTFSELENTVSEVVETIKKYVFFAKRYFLGVRVELENAEKTGRFADSLDKEVLMVRLSDSIVDVFVINSMNVNSFVEKVKKGLKECQEVVR